MTTDENPFFVLRTPIPFDLFRAEHVEPGVRAALDEARADVEALTSDETPPCWDNTMARLEAIAERLTERTSPLSHLIAVAQTPALREAYNAVLPEISAFWSGLILDPALWARIRAFADTPEAARLQGLKRRHLDKTLREFRRAGADLGEEARDRLKEIHVELASLSQRFSENVLDETAAFELLITDRTRLEGVPEAALKRFRTRAREADHEGWLLTLDYPSLEPILKYCRDRTLRREVYQAHALRCREGKHDNRSLIARILRVKQEMATLLGYADFSDYQLAERMARTGARARAFESDLTARTRPYWERDIETLREEASDAGLDRLRPWDVGFLSERARKARYNLDDEALRPYFPLDQVLEGLFALVERVLGFRIEEIENPHVWHPDVRSYELKNEDGEVVGSFYTDWFPRKEKRPGAWMGSFVTGGPREGGFRPHVGVVCGNFTPPDGDSPALLTHREVQTIFHEFGHLLHHCTSRVAIPSRAGIHVAWDWVELPSQLMENWTWEREALDLFARHHETGATIPDTLIERMQQARRFMGGWQQMRQLSFGTVDLELHSVVAAELGVTDTTQEEAAARAGDEVMERARRIFEGFAPSADFAELHSLSSFSHLFAGGYAAGYYSYLWAEVLDADVFTRFREAGVFDAETGRDYVRTILSRGDSADPEELFREFMGRDPNPDALLERNLGPAPVLS